MPQTKTQKIVFGVLMSLVMVYGMETYNHIRADGLTWSAFKLPIAELFSLMAVVIILQETIGGRGARFLAFKFVNPKKDQRLKVIVAVQIFTVFIMCPLMSFVAVIIFKSGDSGTLPYKWLTTFGVNFPMAFIWQLCVAGPVVRAVNSRINI